MPSDDLIFVFHRPDTLHSEVGLPSWFEATFNTGVMTISSSWDKNPYNLITSTNNGDGDYTINMGWNLGNLMAGQIETINFDYALGTDSSGNPDIDPVPEPTTMLLLGFGLLGLAGVSRRKELK